MTEQTAQGERRMEDRVRGLGQTVTRLAYIPVVALILTFILGYVFSAGRPPVYEANSRLIFATSKEFDPFNLSPSYDVQRFLANQAQLIQSPAVLTAAQAKAKSGPTLDELSERVRAAPQKDGGVVVVTATGTSGAEAANLVNNVTAAYSEYIQTSNSKMLAALPAGAESTTLTDLKNKAALYGDGLSQKEVAQAPSKPVAPQPLRDAVFLSLFAALACLAGITAWHLLNPRVRGARRIADLLGVPIIADATSAAPLGELPGGQLQRGMAGVATAGGGAPMLLLVVAAGAPADAVSVARRLLDALVPTEPSARVTTLEEIADPEAAQALRREAAVTLISARDITRDYRLIALGRAIDGIIVVSKPAAPALALDAIRRVAQQADVPIVGVVVDAYDRPPTTGGVPGPRGGGAPPTRMVQQLLGAPSAPNVTSGPTEHGRPSASRAR